MEVLIGLLIIAMIVFIAVAALKNGTGKAKPQYEYVVKTKLLSLAERSFFGVLTQAVGEEGVVLAKIRIADILTPRKGLDKSMWQKTFNRISSKHFDYVVCNPATMEPVLAIELDDKSHLSKTATARDEVKNSASKSAGFPLVRIKAKRTYSLHEIRDSLSEYFPNLIGSELVATPVAQSYSDLETKPEAESELVKEPVGVKPDSPPCPKCSSIMVLRESKKGKQIGVKFWGCSQFPSCRGVQLAEPQNLSTSGLKGPLGTIATKPA